MGAKIDSDDGCGDRQSPMPNDCHGPFHSGKHTFGGAAVKLHMVIAIE